MTEYIYHPKGPNGKPFSKTQMPKTVDGPLKSDMPPQKTSLKTLIEDVYLKGKRIDNETLSQFHLNEVLDNGQYPLEMMVKACCDQEVFYKNKCIHMLCMDTLLTLLKHKATPQLSNIDLTLSFNGEQLSDKGTLLAGACGGFNKPLPTALLTAIVENGAHRDVNSQTQRLKLTPPMIVVDHFSNHENPYILNDILKPLLSAGYQMDKTDINGRNLVMHFVDKIIKNPQEEYNEVLKTLLVYKPDLTQTDKFDKTVFDMLQNQNSPILQKTKKILEDYQSPTLTPTLIKTQSQGRE